MITPFVGMLSYIIIYYHILSYSIIYSQPDLSKKIETYREHIEGQTVIEPPRLTQMGQVISQTLGSLQTLILGWAAKIMTCKWLGGIGHLKSSKPWSNFLESPTCGALRRPSFCRCSNDIYCKGWSAIWGCNLLELPEFSTFLPGPAI